MEALVGFRVSGKNGNDKLTTNTTTMRSHRQALRNLLSRLLLAFLSISALLYLAIHSPRLVTWRSYHGYDDHSANPLSEASTSHSFLPAEDESPEFIWSTIEPNSIPNLTFVPCYPHLYSGKLQCARLQVPLAYQEEASSPESSPATVAIALLLLPAPIPPTHPQHGGTILLNPGGPGGSGVDMLLEAGQNLQTIINPASSLLEQHQKAHHSNPKPRTQESHKTNSPKYFDLLAFDPRGIRRSTPSVQCFSDDDDGFARNLWQMVDEAEGLLGSAFSSEGNEEVLHRKWTRALALARGCSRTTDGSDEDHLEHANTTPVAADMLSIVDAYASFKKRHLERAGVSSTETSGEEEPAKLNLFGVSYGTALGIMFAAMYPSRVGRFILDGTVDAEDYFVYAGNLHTSLVDADKIFDYFLTECVHVGVEGGCAFAALASDQKSRNTNADTHANSLAVEELRQKYEEIVHRIKHAGGIGASIRPPVSHPNHRISPLPLETEIITPTDLEILTRTAIYQPARTFRFFAQVLVDLAVGNATLFAQFKQKQRRDRWVEISSRFASSIGRPPHAITQRLDVRNGFDANFAILCSDMPPSIIHPDQNRGEARENTMEADDQAFERFKEHYASIKNQSRYLGDYWASVRLSCIGWEKEAKWRFDLTDYFDDSSSLSPQQSVKGDGVGSKIKSNIEAKGKILFLSQTFDPVTPYPNAVKMASRFHPQRTESEAHIEIESTVLRQINGMGHNSFSSHSLCKARAVRAWFQGGDAEILGEVDEYYSKSEGGETDRKVNFRSCPIEGSVFDGNFDEKHNDVFGNEYENRKNYDEDRELGDAVMNLFVNGFGRDGFGTAW